MVISWSQRVLFLFSLLLLAFGTSVVLHVDWFFVFNKKCKHLIRKSYFWVQLCTIFVLWGKNFFIFLNRFAIWLACTGLSKNDFLELDCASTQYFLLKVNAYDVLKKQAFSYNEAVLNVSSVVTSIRNVKNALQCILPQNKQ